MKKYIYNVELLLSDKVYNLKAYYDSGNTYSIGKYPIVYLKDKNIIKKGGISSFDNEKKLVYEKAVLKYSLNNEIYYQRVLVIKVSENEDFYGCDMLLNALLF